MISAVWEKLQDLKGSLLCSRSAAVSKANYKNALMCVSVCVCLSVCVLLIAAGRLLLETNDPDSCHDKQKA